MKMRSKGKVYPSPSSSSSVPSCSADRDALSVLKLLPAAILALASVLSLEDRQVLAYMITRSMRSANPPSIVEDKKKNKKPNTHKPPVFDCGCFDCYRSYWFRGKKKEKMGRRVAEKPADISETPVPESELDVPEIEDSSIVVSPENDIFPVVFPEKSEGTAVSKEEVEEAREDSLQQEEAPPLTSAVVLRNSAATNHKGLARKVLPDVLGLFNSRLWSLWSPNA
ncbi:hypothetical protein F0562_033563 [Nyssa sinensis]|uniref:Uncharacterized protein n=1 Tax=Nyssa sinensis TaxID=561372 RepID=A0A5J5AFJ7_9ASTE|nr:hypothetical protein F0562_033563 [Nyssa sinensis]